MTSGKMLPTYEEMIELEKRSKKNRSKPNKTRLVKKTSLSENGQQKQKTDDSYRFSPAAKCLFIMHYKKDFISGVGKFSIFVKNIWFPEDLTDNSLYSVLLRVGGNYRFIKHATISRSGSGYIVSGRGLKNVMLNWDRMNKYHEIKTVAANEVTIHLLKCNDDRFARKTPVISEEKKQVPSVHTSDNKKQSVKSTNRNNKLILLNSLIKLLSNSKTGYKAKELAILLNEDKTTINRVLYAHEKSYFKVDSYYRWTIKK